MFKRSACRDFLPGSCVVLKSGGPNMLVKKRKGNLYTCIWVNDQGTIETRSFLDICLCTLEELADSMLNLYCLNTTD